MLDSNRIVELYNIGVSGPDIATQLDCCTASVYNTLDKFGIVRRETASYSRKLSEDQLRIAIGEYNNGLGLGILAKKFSIDDETLRGRMHKAGVIMHPISVSKVINHDYFTNLDTPRKSYWFGFLCADGSIPSGRTKSRRLQIHLASKDRELLVALQRDLGSTSKIWDNSCISSLNSNNIAFSSTLHVGSRCICGDLIKHGLILIKHGDASPIDKLQYKSDFMRGYFDGDGGLWYCKIRGKYGYIKPHMWCCQYKPILLKFKDILITEGIIGGTLRKRRIWYYQLGANLARRTLEWMCKNERFGLERKCI